MLREFGTTRDRLRETIEENEKKFKELLQTMEAIKTEEEAYLKDLDLTPEQLIAYMENPENFTEEDWATIQREISEQRIKMEKLLSSRVNRVKNHKVYRERATVQPHWLFVR